MRGGGFTVAEACVPWSSCHVESLGSTTRAPTMPNWGWTMRSPGTRLMAPYSMGRSWSSPVSKIQLACIPVEELRGRRGDRLDR